MSIREASTRRVRIVVRTLSEFLARFLGSNHIEIELDRGERRLREIIAELLKKEPKLKRVAKGCQRRPFIAVNDRVIYDENQIVEVDEGTKVYLFTFGAGG